LIAALGLVVLEDDRHYFPPYDAVPIVRPEALRKVAGMQAVFDALAGRISTNDMRRMNYAVDGEKRDVVDVVRSFRESKGL
jgi:osmoprotectant transport system substrate-binding protein